MDIRLADAKDKKQILKYDCHIHHNKVEECIYNGLVYVLRRGDEIVGVLRYNLFWQSIPFLDLIYIDDAYRSQGFGRKRATVLSDQAFYYQIGFRESSFVYCWKKSL